MNIYLQLVFSFVKIGALTFGGGYAMLPMFTRELVEKKGWITEQELLDYYAVSQCTPGVIAVNTATFVGFKKKGVAGAVCATFGVVLPSIIIISVIAAAISSFSSNLYVAHALAGIRVSVCALVAVTVYKLLKKNLSGFLTVIIAVLSFILSGFFSFSPILTVIIAAICGIVYKELKEKENNKK